MTTSQTARPSRPDPVLLSAYLVTVALTALGLWVFLDDDPPGQWLGTALVLAFAFLMLLPDTALGGIRKRFSHVYLGITALIITALMLMPPPNPWFAAMFFVLSPEAMLRFPRQVGYAWIGVFSALTVIAFLAISGWSLDYLIQAPMYIAGYFFFAAFATQTATAQEAQAESERLLRALQDAHARLQEYAAQAEILAVSEERNRMAREMHDTLGHRLTVSAVQLQAIERVVQTDPGRAATMAAAAREEVRAALADLRGTVAALRAPLESDLALSTALRRLAGDFGAATGLTVSLALPDDLPDAGPMHRLALYRAVQEGLTNVHKHAQATRASVGLECVEGSFVLRVADNGRGQAVDSAGGFGLRGLQERAAYLGGTVELLNHVGEGSELVVRLPLAAGGV
jgi:signal transduction histidine kinase